MGETARARHGLVGAIGEPYADYDVPAIDSSEKLVRSSASRFAEKPAFEWASGATVSYAALAHSVDRVVAKLHGTRLRRGSWSAEPAPDAPLVGIEVDDPYLFAAAFFGTLAAGCIAVLCPTGVDRAAFVGGREVCATIDEAFLSSLGIDVPIDRSGNTRAPVSKAPDGAPAGAAGASGLFAGTPDAPVRVILASSGTSGARKAVMLTERGVFADMVAGLQKYAFIEGSRYMSVIPCSHAFGLVCDLMAPLATGGTICVPSDPRTSIAQLGRFAPSQLNVPPRFASALADLIDSGVDVQTLTGGALRKVLCGGAGVDPAVVERLRRHGIEAFGCYGLTECSPCVSVNRDAWRKDGSAGIPLNCNEVLIEVDAGERMTPTRGKSTPAGEICVRGANVMAGYLDRAELTADVLRDGWLHTGDLGRIDEDGFLWVLGRLDDLIVLSDGRKVAPEVVERDLRCNDGVVDAMVFGVDGPHGTELAARVQIKETVDAAALEGMLRKLELPDGCSLSKIELSSEALPRTLTGKLKRR